MQSHVCVLLPITVKQALSFQQPLSCTSTLRLSRKAKYGKCTASIDLNIHDLSVILINKGLCSTSTGPSSKTQASWKSTETTGYVYTTYVICTVSIIPNTCAHMPSMCTPVQIHWVFQNLVRPWRVLVVQTLSAFPLALNQFHSISMASTWKKIESTLLNYHGSNDFVHAPFWYHVLWDFWQSNPVSLQRYPCSPHQLSWR